MNFILLNQEPSEKELVNDLLCKTCGGACCKKCGCAFSPDDIPALKSFSKENIKRYLRFKLMQGRTSIALHITEEFQYALTHDIPFPFFSKERAVKGMSIFYLRIRNIERPIVDIFFPTPDFSAPCILLGENGCKLPFNKRPKEGRYLVPSTQCHVLTPVKERMAEWLPYQDILYDLVLEFVDEVPSPFVFL